MLVQQKYRKCITCGCIGGLFVARKRKLADGVNPCYIQNRCRVCANEMSKERHYRLSNDPEWLDRKRKRNLAYKQLNKEKIKQAAKLYWIKNKDRISKQRKLKKEIVVKVKNRFKKNSHHRVPTNKLTYGNFNFKNVGAK